MQINEYKRALDGVDDVDLENLAVTRVGNQVVLEYPDDPPAQWSNFTGAVKSATKGHAEDPGHSMQASDAALLPPEHFLDGFVADMNEAFGEAITRDCLSVHYPEPGKRLTARHVKQIIDTAEQMLEKSGVTALLQEQAVGAENDATIARFLKDDDWAGILFIEPDSFQAALLRLQGRELLPENAARFVKTMTTALCRNSPEYAKDFLSMAMLRETAKDVTFIQKEISRHFRSTPAALDKVWSLLEHALAKKGVDHVLAMWPVYMAAAQSFSDLIRLEDSPFQQHGEGGIRLGAMGFAPVTLASIASCHVDTFLKTVEGQSWLEGSITVTWRSKYQRALQVSRDCSEGIAKAYFKQHRILARNDDLTEWQKLRIVAWLSLAPRTMASFSSVVELTTSIGETLANLAGKRQPQAVFEAVANICRRVAAPALSLSDPALLLTTTLGFGVAALSPGQARKILAWVQESDQTTRRLMAESGLPQAAEVCAMLVATLQQRIPQASNSFQFTLKKLLCLNETRRFPKMSASTVNAVSPNFVTVVRNSIVELISREGLPILDLPVLLGIKDKKAQLEYVQSRLYQVLALDPKHFNHRVLLASLTNILQLLQEIYWRTCWETVFSYDASGMMHLVDGSDVLKLEGDVEPTSRVTLVATADDGCIHFGYCARYSAVRSALVAGGGNRWLDSSKSQIRFDAEFTLHPSGSMASLKPVVCQCNLVPAAWPESKAYPQPIARDLMVRDQEENARAYGQILLHVDLREFAASSGDINSITALDVLSAIQTYVEGIRGRDFDNALVIYEDFIAPDRLDFLGNRRVIGNILEAMYPLMDTSRLIPALNEFIKAVTEQPAPHELLSPIRSQAIDQLRKLGQECDTNEPAENRWAFRQLVDSLYDQDGPLMPWLNRVPSEIVDAMIKAFSLYHAAPSRFIFSDLEDDLVEFLGKGILPAFIESVMSKSSGGSSAT